MPCRLHQFGTGQEQHQQHRKTNATGQHQCGPPVTELYHRHDKHWCSCPAYIARQRVDTIGSAEPWPADLIGQDGEIGRMKNTVADAANNSERNQHPEL